MLRRVRLAPAARRLECVSRFPPARILIFVLDSENMALVDSTAEFLLRVSQLGLKEHETRFVEAGVATFAQLAFFSGYSPGGAEEVFNDTLAAPLLGDGKHVHRPALRRLFVEAYTLAAADLQKRVEPRSDLHPSPMPSAEREARLQALLRRLPGVKLTPAYEPSHKALDLAHELYEINSVKHIDLSVCTTRRAELEGAKVDKTLKVDASAYLRENQVTTLANIDVKDLLTFRQALTRRSIMLDVADIVSLGARRMGRFAP